MIQGDLVVNTERRSVVAKAVRALILILVTVVSLATIPAYAQIIWPARGEACYECYTNPNCIWTCPNGSHGSANVPTEISCKNACRASCGAAANCFLI